MLFLLKLVRTVFKELKSDLTPTQIGIGVFWGVLWGLTPFGAHTVLLFLLALLFNGSLASTFLVAGALKPVGLLLAPAFFSLGYDQLGGDGPYRVVVASLSAAPVLAWLGFERYLLAGAYLVAAPAAVVLGLSAKLGVALYRRKPHELPHNRALRFVSTLLAGKPRESITRRPLPIRPSMLVLVPLLAVGLAAGAGIYAQWIVADLVGGAASRALGVKVSFASVDYSFFAQRLRAAKFQLPDPSMPGQDLVRIGDLVADLDFGELLARRFVIEELSASDVVARVERDADGTFNVAKLPAAESAGWGEFAAKVPDLDYAGLWKRLSAWRSKRAAAPPPPPAPKPDYDASLAWIPPGRQPRFRVVLAELRNVKLGLPAFDTLSLRVEELSAEPGWNGKPLRIAGNGLEAAVRADGADLRIALENAPLVGLKACYERSLPVAVEAGSATIAFEARSSARLDASAKLRLGGLKLALKPGQKSFLGLDPEASAHAIEGLNLYCAKAPLAFGARIEGPAEDPAVSVDVDLLATARKGLLDAGKQELEARLGRQVEILRGASSKAVDAAKAGDVDALKKVVPGARDDAKKEVQDAKDALEGVKDLFKRKDKK
jgi:hypothetical protein